MEGPEDRESLARKIAKYNLLAVPVLEQDGSVVGFVTVDNVIDVLIEEQPEDVLQMAAVEPGGARPFVLRDLDLARCPEADRLAAPALSDGRTHGSASIRSTAPKRLGASSPLRDVTTKTSTPRGRRGNDPRDRSPWAGPRRAPGRRSSLQRQPTRGERLASFAPGRLLLEGEGNAGFRRARPLLVSRRDSQARGSRNSKGLSRSPDHSNAPWARLGMVTPAGVEPVFQP